MGKSIINGGFNGKIIYEMQVFRMGLHGNIIEGSIFREAMVDYRRVSLNNAWMLYYVQMNVFK